MLSPHTALAPEPATEAMDPNATHASQLPPGEAPRTGPVRFTYAGGARPLDGFTIKRGIGRGGFGEVYFAVSDGGKEVALKLIRHNLDVELRGVTHCLNLKHPNLIALYDVRQDAEENTWVVMEYAVGESLEDALDRNPSGLSLEEALDWMNGIGAGVAYLHDHGIVHRDLKPGNIFLDDGQVKLGDYGLSKFISCSRRSGQTESIGTVHYMAPEVANGRYGKEIDIYALGVILYEILTGQVPFEGESVGEVLMKHLTAEPSLERVPEAYRPVIARALAKDPSTRFASVGEMFNAMPALAATAAYRPPIKETRYASEPPRAEELPEPNPAEPAAAPRPEMYTAMGAGAAGAAADPMLPDDEPVWRAVRDGWRSARESWDGLNTPTKVAVAVIGCAGLAINAGLVLRLIVPVILVYILYRVIRAVVIAQDNKKFAHSAPVRSPDPVPNREPVARPGPLPAGDRKEPPATMYVAHQAAYRAAEEARRAAAQARGDWRAASERHWKRRKRKSWRETASEALVVKSSRERLADLAGSLILAAVIGTVMSIVAVLLRGETTVEQNQFAWLALTSVLGSWAVLIPAKFWEGTGGDQTLRRVTMLVLGLGVGAAAYVGARQLLVNFNDSPAMHDFVQLDFGKNFYDAQGMPLLGAYLAYFGALFAGVRWWKLADPLRPTRLSVWSVGGCVLGAWIVDWIWRFPQPWGVMVAAIISTSVQLAGPQVQKHERSETAERKEA